MGFIYYFFFVVGCFAVDIGIIIIADCHKNSSIFGCVYCQSGAAIFVLVHIHIIRDIVQRPSSSSGFALHFFTKKFIRFSILLQESVLYLTAERKRENK